MKPSAESRITQVKYKTRITLVLGIPLHMFISSHTTLITITVYNASSQGPGCLFPVYLPGKSHGISHCTLQPTLPRKEKNIFNHKDLTYLTGSGKKTVSYKPNSEALYYEWMNPL